MTLETHPVRVAAIDCGTNSIRLLVADLLDDGTGRRVLRDVHREMRIVRLGQDVDATGRLAPDALRRTTAALTDYATIAARHGVERIRMVATSATRDASNTDEFFTMTRDVLGTTAEVISGAEEAALSFTGAAGDLDPADGPFLVIDVGGGSTELVLGTWDGGKADVRAARSVDIGSVRLTERCLPGDPPTAAEVATATRVATEELAAAFETVPVRDTRTFVGVSGTVTTLAAVSLNLADRDQQQVHLARLPLAEIDRVSTRLLRLRREQRANIAAIHPGRIDVIGAGALIVRIIAERLAEEAGITEMVVSQHDILDGVALSLA